MSALKQIQVIFCVCVSAVIDLDLFVHFCNAASSMMGWHDVRSQKATAEEGEIQTDGRLLGIGGKPATYRGDCPRRIPPARRGDA